jgi:hypothetical protein
MVSLSPLLICAIEQATVERGVALCSLVASASRPLFSLIWRNHRRRYTPLLPVCRTGVRRFQETRASLKGWVFRESPACHLPFQASGRPNSPFYPRGRRGSSQGWIFWQAPACHLPFQPSGRPTPFSPCGSRADRKYVRCTFPAASERHGRQVWNPPLPVQCVGADRIADCALQWQKTYLCSNVLSALKPLVGEGGWGDEG